MATTKKKAAPKGAEKKMTPGLDGGLGELLGGIVAALALKSALGGGRNADSQHSGIHHGVSIGAGIAVNRLSGERKPFVSLGIDGRERHMDLEEAEKIRAALVEAVEKAKAEMSKPQTAAAGN